MAHEFDPLEEVRKHPGIVAGTVFVLAGIGLGTLLLNQRTGPRRYEVLRERFSPRTWMDTPSLRERVSDFARGVRGGVGDLGDQATDFGNRAQRRMRNIGDEMLSLRRDHDRRRARSMKRKTRDYRKSARRYAEDAGDFAADHVREGSAILAVAAIAAAIGAVAWENQRKGGGLLE